MVGKESIWSIVAIVELFVHYCKKIHRYLVSSFNDKEDGSELGLLISLSLELLPFHKTCLPTYLSMRSCLVSKPCDLRL